MSHLLICTNALITLNQIITDKQTENIKQLTKAEQLEILHICAENLGLVSAQEYADAYNMPIRTVYAKIKDGTIKSFEISGKNYPLVCFEL